MAWTLTESYSDSAGRLYRDAVALQRHGDPATAGHLFGISAECAAKSALENSGITIDRPSGLKTHFPQLGQAILRSGRTRHMTFLLGILSVGSFLDGYTADTRYAAAGSIDVIRCAAWQADAEMLLRSCGFVM